MRRGAAPYEGTQTNTLKLPQSLILHWQLQDDGAMFSVCTHKSYLFDLINTKQYFLSKMQLKYGKSKVYLLK